MPCYHPLKRFITGINNKTGKTDGIVVPYEVKYIIKENNKFLRFYDSYCANALNCGEKLCTYDDSCFKAKFPFVNRCKSETGEIVEHPVEVFYKFQTIPCGQCIGCRIDYSKQWATRMLLENEYSSESHFVTLTYDDAHVPKHEYLDPDNGELLTSLSLCKKDMQDFHKRLRRHFSDCNIRYYYCGEYGSMTLRPHYHSIYFNLPLSDLRFHRMSSDGKFKYWISPTLSQIWGKGHVLVCDVSFETCAYVARYVTKKIKGKANEAYEFFNIEPEFGEPSRKPGLGRKWFDDNWRKVYDTYIINISSLKGGLKLKPPRYYDNIFDGLDGVRMAQIKENQQTKAQNLMRMKLEETNLNLLELLEVEEYNFLHGPKTSHLAYREEL